MISIRRMPIRQKLILMMLCTGIAAVLLVSTAFIGYEMSTYRQRLLDEAATLAKIIADRSNAALLFGDARLLQDNLDSLALHGSIEVACIYAADDNVVARFLRNSRALCPGNPRDLPNQNPLGLLNLSEPVMLDGDVLGHLYLGANQSELRRHLRNYLLTALGVISLVIFVVWQLSHRLQRVVSAPIHHLVETANEIAGNHNYQLRAYKESEDEIGTLVEAFNSMLDTIDAQNKTILDSYNNLERIVEQRTADLRAANKELEAFSYSVSHDLRQPLRAIDGFSLAILEDCGDQLDAQGQQYLQRVRAASQRMGSLIDSMLHLSRVTRQEMRIAPVDLSALAKEVVDDLRAQFPERQINAYIQPGMQVRGDSRLLEIALSNLLGNAWKYTAGTLGAEVRFGIEQQGVNPVFCIADNGAGFDMKYQEKLFHAFQRLHSPHEFEGSGIGLAIVDRIIKRHGGQIWAEAEPGKGARFFFTLGSSAD